MYDDDTSFIVTGDNLNALHVKLSRELNNLSKWVSANKFKLNVNKTHVMLFQNKSLMYNVAPVKLRQKLFTVFTTKFWEVLIDGNLNWKHHITNHCNTLSNAAIESDTN